MLQILANQALYLDSQGKHEESNLVTRWIESYAATHRPGVRLASKDNIGKKTLYSVKYPLYTYKKQLWAPLWDNTSPWCPIEACYSNVDGSYIGDPKEAKMLCIKHGIAPEKSQSDHNVSSIGFSEKQNKWFGWSHRAMKGFGIGDKGEAWWPQATHKSESVAKTLDEAKEFAKAFAESVS